ncbi:hypothetical protein SAMN05444360_102182 [Chryseobacterium carnipullorum]|uniref:hypothetical protein n=1 Tax=Chryseobacterium carnipullorum TaxID=1124835 RepID=UPI00091807E1|nr:hypothetical protein [Chryseobacterium carnipullorum]SHL52415.1 hypothetical protein SAMN05444360_102182 [Chryseobacterium carnipullorum]
MKNTAQRHRTKVSRPAKTIVKSSAIEIKPLYLPIQKVYFDQIESGIKKIEYRDDTPHYRSRFLNKKGELRNHKVLLLQEGYHDDARRMLVEIVDIQHKQQFETHLGRIIERINF